MDIGEVIDEILKADKTAIPIDIGIGPPGFFNITKSVVITWGIIIAWLVIGLFMTSGKKNSRRQEIFVLFVSKLREIVNGMLGEGGKGYADYILTVLFCLGLSNMVGLLGLTPPTMDLNMTAGMAIISIIVVEMAGIRAKGLKGWLNAFKEPIPVVLPMNILEIFIRPLSLCMRLFGNILGATVIMELIKSVLPVFVPAMLGMYFDIFDGLIQAYVFCFLTSLYIAETTEPKEEEAEAGAESKEVLAEHRREERLRLKEERRVKKALRKKEREKERFDARAFYRRIMMLPPEVRDKAA